nr:MAG TPA: hypothetical protein [Caudoviricetes sp.]DAK79430.1 MAG TPA: hypothetical protein [Caudoviricetes sp.]DAM67822.1 MAG TPA: hypothetical protein [Caudoviricetes sp.]
MKQNKYSEGRNRNLSFSMLKFGTNPLITCLIIMI